MKNVASTHKTWNHMLLDDLLEATQDLDRWRRVVDYSSRRTPQRCLGQVCIWKTDYDDLSIFTRRKNPLAWLSKFDWFVGKTHMLNNEHYISIMQIISNVKRAQASLLWTRDTIN